MTSLAQILEQTLNETDMDRIPLTAMVEVLANHTGQTKEVIYGTICHLGPHKMLSKAGFAKNAWTKVNERGRGYFIRKSTSKQLPTDQNDYACAEKQEMREWIFKDILHKYPKAKILTMCGKDGLDVEFVLGHCKSARITTVEREAVVRETYAKRGFPTTDFAGTMDEFLAVNSSERFSLINYDTYSYLCKSTAETMHKMNAQRSAEYIVITMQNCKGFRNVGEYQTLLRGLYGHLDDPTQAAMKDVLSNYDLIAEKVYAGSGSHQKMRMFKFKVKA